SRDADARSDIYSLGCTLYYLLTGQHAFTGTTPEEILRKHELSDFRRPAEIRPDVPPSLEAIVLKMMSVNPEDRYPTASLVAKVFRFWRTQESLEDPSSVAEPVRIGSVHELREALLRLRIVSCEEWDTIEEKVKRNKGRTAWQMTTMLSTLSME